MPRKTFASSAVFSTLPRSASMRPRPDAAENCDARGRTTDGQYASMRPRPDAAENAQLPVLALDRPAASMRPRPDAAENSGCSSRPDSPPPCFNEAAARCRGKPFGPCACRRRRRPCFNEAAARCRGKRSTTFRRPTTTPGFNEAAARCRGKPRAAGRAGCARRRFNEAAARCRGKLALGESRDHPPAPASMRPRPDAAENAMTMHAADPARSASMRPRPDAAENGAAAVDRLLLSLGLQ